VKWTLTALIRDPFDGDATESMYTEPVNQSSGPAAVSRLFFVICIWVSWCGVVEIFAW
jgi:hypothetical protein